ncbi:MAG: metal-dependent transcriptional regulator [Chitinophagales bacterium]|nr:metal-dependent transcriptional regulator [Chitinophagales bacterium]
MTSASEENYLKNIYLIYEKNGNLPVTTNELSAAMDIKAASASDMLQRLAARKLIHYKKYQGVLLTRSGKSRALAIVRKHRLWEYFLVEKLHFQWDEVHNVAEELEHVESDLLVNKLDIFLGRPKFDPHGDPIPDHQGKIATHRFRNLTTLSIRDKGTVAGVIEQSPSFLQHLDRLQIHMGTPIRVKDLVDYDKSMSIIINNRIETNISFDVAKNILISK